MRFTSQSRLLSIVILAIGCREPTEPEPQGEFRVSNAQFVLQLGDSIRFLATGTGSRSVKWSSSNPAVLEIDETGLVVTHSLGVSEIAASVRGNSWGWRLAVVRPIAAFEIEPADAAVVPGDRVLYTARAVDGLGGPVTEEPEALTNIAGTTLWSVADLTIAQGDVNLPWVVTGLREGHTTVRASLLAGTGAANLTIQLLEFTELAAGGGSNCALATDSLPYCWGNGTRFLAATSSFTPAHLPHRAGPPVPLVALVSGGRHSCGLTAAGVAYCWGSNELGALGIGNATQPIGPVAVTGGLRFSSLTAGGGHTCGIATDGRTFCWGRREATEAVRAGEPCGTGGKLEIVIPCDRAPTPLRAETPVLGSLSAGGRHTCGLDRDGHVHCWGRWGSRVEPAPVPVGSALTFTALTAGDGYSCGLTTGGAAYCWGGNTDGQLGNDTTTPSDEPVAVSGGLVFASLSAGRSEHEFAVAEGHVCGVTLSGAAYCWGANHSGETGVPANPHQTAPVPVSAPFSFRWVRAGGDHTCGLSLQRVVYCWGADYGGQLGVTAPAVSGGPVPVTGQRTPTP